MSTHGKQTLTATYDELLEEGCELFDGDADTAPDVAELRDGQWWASETNPDPDVECQFRLCLVGGRLDAHYLGTVRHGPMTVAEEVRAEELLAADLASYAGRWVAIIDHRVIASAATLEELLVEVQGKEDEAEVFQVAEDGATACFY